MKFSLIVSTINRTKELIELLDSLVVQSHKDFEVIIVDQNTDDRLISIIEEYKESYVIKYVKSERGLSRGRNEGLKLITGDIVAFPDDDCRYHKDLLNKVHGKFLNRKDVGCVTGQAQDEQGHCSSMRSPTTFTLVNLINVWWSAISFTIFIKKEVVQKIGDFDNSLGVGSGTKFGAGEETDYIIRIIKQNYRVCYYPDIVVFHPVLIPVIDDDFVAKIYSYGCGMGRVLAKHDYGFLGMKGYFLTRSLVGMIFYGLKFNFKRAFLLWNSFKGRLYGMTHND